MSAKDKELQLRDLCARLQYGVMCKTTNSDKPQRLKGIIRHHKLWWFEFGGFRSIECKPYLRSMSSMTDEEKKEFIRNAGYEISEEINGRHYEYYLKDFCGTEDNPYVNVDAIDWLNERHFDYRRLIENGLAIEVTEENNPYKL